MGLFASKSKTKSRTTRLVVTGKRQKGTWIMESRLSPKPRRARGTQSVPAAENRRVRTLH